LGIVKRINENLVQVSRNKVFVFILAYQVAGWQGSFAKSYLPI